MDNAEHQEQQRRITDTLLVQQGIKPPQSRATLFVVAAIILCVIDAVFIVALTLARPLADNMPLITVIIGITSPMTVGLMAAALQQVNVAVDGRLTQLLLLTAESRFAAGKLQGLTMPVPGAQTEEKLKAIQTTLMTHDQWERTREAQLSRATAEGTAAGIEQERVRTEAREEPGLPTVTAPVLVVPPKGGVK